ncbi:hypothetical protein [Streptomyces sp. UNOB3_S3]|uniref:hypothetical protein n=1 Tax=Streptomyces sp. UNOB3_S3 TaxID=2871682 RepID=UPI001E476B96|nr:hypothetical protein [Streptomyces sp. UNOB3_S3]MCC3777562.1 hypothetical protein [Streptomyces sp. UNOB3_S3]
MKSRAFRLTPAAAVLTAGLLLAGASGAAVATPADDSASATSNSANKSDDKQTSPTWYVRSRWQSDQDCCYAAGNHGQNDTHEWHQYKCQQHGNWWWLYTDTKP